MTDSVPSEARGRLERAAFSSSLTIPDFAACLHMGMQPVGLVQGYCVMRWSAYPTAYAITARPGVISTYNCPHLPSDQHMRYGQNWRQSSVEQAWTTGWSSAFQRMLEEAAEAGAHGVVGVVHREPTLIDNAIHEFHLYGTAVTIQGQATPEQPWSTYLAGQRLAKLIESGFWPVSVVASLASVRMYAACVTDELMKGKYTMWGGVQPGSEIIQLGDAQVQARHLARNQMKKMLGGDALHGVAIETGHRELREGDLEVNCLMRGTRIRRFKAADPLPLPIATVNLQ